MNFGYKYSSLKYWSPSRSLTRQTFPPPFQTLKMLMPKSTSVQDRTGSYRRLNLSDILLYSQTLTFPKSLLSLFRCNTMGIDPNSTDESSLLEELGINNQQIWSKMVLIFNPFRVNPNLHKDTDLSGPFLLLMSFGLFQLLTEKIHLGIILGWVTVAALFLHVVFNMLVGRNGNLDLYRCD